VLKEMQRALPEASYVYFADMARQPYGPRHQEEIAGFSQQILTFLQQEGCDIGIIACNTATCATYDHGVDTAPELTLDIYGPIQYAAEAARQAGKTTVGVIATQGTVSTKAYSRALGDSIETIEMPCPEFANIVEDGRQNEANTRTKALEYLLPALDGNVDALIYGCTHYPLLADVVEDVMGSSTSGVHFIDPATVVAEAVKRKITEQTQQHSRQQPAATPGTRFCVNAAPENFKARATGILGYDVDVEEVTLPQTSMLQSFYEKNA